MRDPLYLIFERHLMNALVEDETLDELLARVISTYISHLRADGTTVPASHAAALEADLREEVLEMYRKKTYGHYDLASYRQARGIEASPGPIPEPLASAQNEKARRGGRAS